MIPDFHALPDSQANQLFQVAQIVPLVLVDQLVPLFQHLQVDLCHPEALVTQVFRAHRLVHVLQVALLDLQRQQLLQILEFLVHPSEEYD